jgi:hypothetical protein
MSDQRYLSLKDLPGDYFTEKSIQGTAQGVDYRIELQTKVLQDPVQYQHRLLITAKNPVEGLVQFIMPAEMAVHMMEAFYQPMHKFVDDNSLVQHAAGNAVIALKDTGRTVSTEDRMILAVGASAMLGLLQNSDDLADKP